MKNKTLLKISMCVAAVVFMVLSLLIMSYFDSFGRAYGEAGENVDKYALEYKRASTSVAVGVQDELTSIVRLKKSEIDLTAAKIDLYNLEIEKQVKDYPDHDQAKYDFAKSELRRLSEKIELSYRQKYRIPTDLYYVFLKDQNTYPSHKPRSHFAENGLLAIDLGTHQKSLQMYAPDLYNKEIEWYAETIEYPESLGHTIILTNEELGAKWFIGHSIYMKSDFPRTIKTGEELAFSSGTGEGQGVYNGPHAHLEFFTLTDEKWQATNYKITGSNKHDLWNWTPDKNVYGTEESINIYLSGYNWGDIDQNDREPCIGASEKRICERIDMSIPYEINDPNNLRWLHDPHEVIALMGDVKNLLGVEYGDKVKVSCEDGREITASVEDTMNARYLECVKSVNSGSLCIKGDIGFPLGESVKGCRAIVSRI